MFICSYRHLCFYKLLFFSSVTETANVLFYRYLITAPKTLRLDASENVVVQLFGYDEETTVNLQLKNTLAQGYKEYASQSLKLNAANNYQASATLRVGLQS